MTMFCGACCFVTLPLHPQPHAGIPCPRRSHRARAPTAVSAAPRRRGSRGPRRDTIWDDESGDSDSDDRIDAGFFGQQEDDEEETEQDELPQPPTRADSPESQLRGTDVLRALQRAVAAKEAKKKKDKKPAAPRQRHGKVKGGGEVAVDGEVRPVVINPEWAARIRELELRVQQLADKYHH